MRTAIFGISGFGRTHYRLLLEAHHAGQLEATAAVVINPEETQEQIAELKKIGCRIYGSSTELWDAEPGIDFCMIPTSICSHALYVEEALRKGSHVFVEKPFTATVDDGERLNVLARELGKTVLVGFQDCYSPDIRDMKERILAGEFGSILRARCICSWPRALEYFRRNNWAGRIRCDDGWVLDSPLNNAASHFLMLMLFLSGETVSSVAEPAWLEGELLRIQPIESFDSASIRLATTRGVDVFYILTHSAGQTVQPKIRMDGTDGWIEWSHCHRMSWSGKQGSGEVNLIPVDVLYANMMATILGTVRGEPGYWGISGEQALQHTRVINALHDFCPIVDVPRDRIVEQQQGGTVFRRDPELMKAMEIAYENQRLFSEVNYIQRESPQRVSLQGYHSFNGGLVPTVPGTGSKTAT